MLNFITSMQVFSAKILGFLPTASVKSEISKIEYLDSKIGRRQTLNYVEKIEIYTRKLRKVV